MDGLALDIITTMLGLLYIALEYRAHIALWLVGILMPALDVWLYWSHGLYGDAGMAVYYTVAGVYGWAVWRFGKKRSVHKNSEAADSSTSTDELPITRMPRRLYLPTGIVFLVLWAATYWVLVTFTNSSVPVMDAFTNALSFVGLWALARKYVEQWLFWIIVDAICTYLYVIKGIPFKAGLYGLYVIIAIAGLRKWNSQVVKR
jgi:nicotinamide mononucleotide transporter